jgi:putative glutathione S-transferase
MTHDRLNPSRIVPLGPIVDWSAPHGRDALA